MNRSIPLFLATSLPVLLAQTLFGHDWPQWRGPARNGLSQETGLLKEWPKEGPKLLWTAKGVGSGYSTPAVAGERLYLLANQGLDNEFVLCLSVKDGQRVWSTPLGKVGNPNQQPSFPAARSTPTVDGEQIYALSSDGDLACLGTDGKVRWSKNIRTEFGGQPGTWAYAESPLVDGDAVICTPGGRESTVIALNKKTGEVIWKCAVPGGDQAAYASAMPADVGGIKQYVQFVQKGLLGIEAKTGKLLWRYDRTAQGSPAVIPSPVVRGGSVYSAAARSGGGLVSLKANDGAVTAEQVYFSPKLPTAIGGAVLVGDCLYATTATALECVEFATGNVKWEDRAMGPASLCCAEGRLYLHGENGEVGLVEAKPDGYRERGRFTPPELPKRANPMEKAWAYPVVANGKLFIRDLGLLWCYDIKAADK
jgi:outer membrane protein assembly factor BamB